MLVDKTQFVKALKLTELVPCKREKLAIVSAEQARPACSFPDISPISPTSACRLSAWRR